MGRLRIPESWKLFLWNSESCVLESGIQVPLTKNPESSCWNLESTAWNPRRGIQSPGLSWIPLNGATRRIRHFVMLKTAFENLHAF